MKKTKDEIYPERLIPVGIVDMHNVHPATLRIGQTFDVCTSEFTGTMTVAACLNLHPYGEGLIQALETFAQNYSKATISGLFNKMLTVVGYDPMDDQFVAVFNYDNNHGGICKLEWEVAPSTD